MSIQRPIHPANRSLSLWCTLPETRITGLVVNGTSGHVATRENLAVFMRHNLMMDGPFTAFSEPWADGPSPGTNLGSQANRDGPPASQGVREGIRGTDGAKTNERRASMDRKEVPRAGDADKKAQEQDDDHVIGEDDGEDELTYSRYMSVAMRDMHPNIKGHPDPLVETSSLRSVTLPPVAFDHCLHNEVAEGVLSDAQMESVVYANMRFRMQDRPRPGFFLGDGAGVGKGRQIAAMIKQHWHDGGRRILWISVSQDLRIDSRRDLDDIGANHIAVHDSGIPSRSFDGVTFMTYSLLRYGLPKAKRTKGSQYDKDRDDSQMDGGDLQSLANIGPKSNLKVVIDWLKDCPEGGLLIFDESHKAKNLLPTVGSVPTQTEPRNMAYMVRLGLGGIGEGTAANLIEILSNARLDALELAAMSLKAAGAYLARSLSYDGAEFEMTKAFLEKQFLVMYERSCEVWMQLYDIMQVMGSKRWPTVYWGAHQRFFKSMLMAAKVPTITQMTEEALKAGYCVVIGLQSTGEAAADHMKTLEEPVGDFVSAPKMSLHKLVSNKITVDEATDTNTGDIGSSSEQLDAVHKSTFELAKKLRDQPSIASIEEAVPGLNDDLKIPSFTVSRGNVNIGAKIKGLKETIQKLESRKLSKKLLLMKLGRPSRKDLQMFLQQQESEQNDPENNDTSNISARRSARKSRRRTAVSVDYCEDDDGDDGTYEALPDSRDMEASLEHYVRAYSRKNAILDIRKWMLYIVKKMDLPANPLDSLIDNLGGPDKVAELTGRKGGLYMDDYGQVAYKDRGVSDEYAKKDINLVEKDLFMRGNKLVAIISDASSTGISLQADRRVVNQRRRYHITLELPWSADKAIQQFGRSHRANQVSAPIYQMVVTPCGGEYRFAAAAAKRLSSLGALLKGDRNALGAGSELKSFDVDTDLGARSLTRFLDSFAPENQSPLNNIKIQELPPRLMLGVSDPDASATKVFFLHFTRRLQQIGLLDDNRRRNGKDSSKVTKFLNRLLGLPIDEQEVLFAYFSDVMEDTRQVMKSEGSLDRGILKMDVKASIVDSVTVYLDPQTKSAVYRQTLTSDSGKTWDDTLGQYEELMQSHNHIYGVKQHSGFYVSSMRFTLNGEKTPKIKLVNVIPDENANDTHPWRVKVRQIEPCGKYSSITSLFEAIKRQQQYWHKVDIPAAEKIWKRWYNYLETRCFHGDNCRKFMEGEICHMGTRKSNLHILSGGLLPFWKRLHDLSSVSEYEGRVYYARDAASSARIRKKRPLDIVRVVTEDGEPIVGIQAVGKEEMDFFQQQLAIQPGTPGDAVLEKRGSAFYEKKAGPSSQRKKKRYQYDSSKVRPV
eukprot:jgi/Picre1/29215/NNA_004607.t1